MDDEEVIRDAVGGIIKALGYSVVCTRNGKETIDFFTSEKRAEMNITAIILDLTISGGDGGKETISKIRKMDEKIPAFVASGYADDPVMANPEEYGFTASICKPFRKAELAEILERYLQAQDSEKE